MIINIYCMAWNPAIATLITRDLLQLSEYADKATVFSNSGNALEIAELFGYKTVEGTSEESDAMIIYRNKEHQTVETYTSKEKVYRTVFPETDRQPLSSEYRPGPQMPASDRARGFDPFAVPPPPNRPGLPVDTYAVARFG